MFPQWVRAKSFDAFGPFGPVVATKVQPEELRVRTILNGEERQNYPVSDMIFPAAQLVSLLSHDMTLLPGDVICCGTSVGVGVMKNPVNTIEVAIAGIWNTPQHLCVRLTRSHSDPRANGLLPSHLYRPGSRSHRDIAGLD